jgi:hypothetical protein
MARQAAVKRVELVDAPPVPAGPRRVQKPQKAPKVFDYSRFRVSFHKEEEFRRYLEGYPDKNGLMGYVYRLLPRIDVNLIGQTQTNIIEVDDISKMTSEFIGSKFHRGKYMLKLTDANRPQGQREVAKTWFDLQDHELPPVYDVRTLVLGHPDNIDEVNRQITAGNLIRDETGQPRLRTGAEDAPEAVRGSGAGDLLGRDFVSKVLLQLVSQGVESPGERMRQSIEIAKLLQPPAAAALPVTVDAIAEKVALKLAANGGSSHGSGDPFDQWEKIENFLAKARGDSPARPASSDGSMVRDLAALLMGVSSAWPTIERAIDKMQRMRPVQAVGAPGGAPGAAVQPAAPAGPQILPLMDRIADVARLGFTQMNEGVTGFDFAAWVCNWYAGGLEVYRTLEPGGVPGVISMAAMNPETRPLVNDAVIRPKLELFLQDFFSYDPDGASGSDPDDEDDDDDEEPVGANAAGS